MKIFARNLFCTVMVIAYPLPVFLIFLNQLTEKRLLRRYQEKKSMDYVISQLKDFGIFQYAPVSDLTTKRVSYSVDLRENVCEVTTE